MGQFTNGLQNGQLNSPAVLHGLGEMEELFFPEILEKFTSVLEYFLGTRFRCFENSIFETITLDQAQ